MPRLNVVRPEDASGALEETYDGIKQKFGAIPNIFQGMGNSVTALNAYLGMAGTLSEGDLAPEDREVIYLAVSEHNGCHYCVSAHTMIAKNIGMAENETLTARRFESPDARRNALLKFIRRVIDTKGFVTDDDVTAVREAGYTDGQIAESIAYIGLATYSNLFNHVHDTPLDFPAAPQL